MCTVVVRIAPDEEFPLLLAANRDERTDRPWDLPGAWWEAQPDVVGGRDRTGGGTWMAMNGEGVVACVLNRPGSLGPAPGKRSRGELPLIALRGGSAAEGAKRIAAIPAREYRPFNLVLADRAGAIFQRWSGEGTLETRELSVGVHMITARDPDDSSSPRIARHLPRFRQAAPPDPAQDEWHAWRTILADPSGPPGSEINVPARAGFGTICSSLLAIGKTAPPVWLFAPGPPDRASFARVSLPSRSCAARALAAGDGD